MNEQIAFQFIVICASTLFSGGYLLHSSQVVELDTVDLLLLQHQLLEVLSGIWLPLKCLESLS